jgi:hypothetical protein
VFVVPLSAASTYGALGVGGIFAGVNVGAALHTPTFGLIMFAAVGVLAVGGVWLLVRSGRFALNLYPDRLVEGVLPGAITVPWAALLPGGPPPPPPGAARLDVYLWQPTLGVAAKVRIPLRTLAVQPAFLANAIRHYVEHPEYRAGIGTAAEYARLQAALRAEADANLGHSRTHTGA